MPPVKKPAAKPRAKPASKAEAARKEAANEAPVADFHGLKITLPPKMPASFPLRLGKLQHSTDEDGAGAMYGFFADFFGAEQMDAVMDKMDEGEDDFLTAIGDLIEAILAPYGAEPGEPNASAGS